MPAGRLILGIDPGLAATGYGLLGDRDEVHGCGSIATRPGPIGSRLLQIVTEVDRLLADHDVGEAALEQLFMNQNRTSAMAVAQARGAIIATLERAGIPTFEYTPLQVKALLTGYGMADKRQMARMLFQQVRLERDSRPDDHAVDAVAIAVCHSRTRRLRAAQGSHA